MRACTVSGEMGGGRSRGWRFFSRPPGHPSQTARRSGGYNLVILAVAVTVLNILVAKALPLWSHQVQRQKEEELIFRGLQYAEAIRLFESRAQRLPTKLEELVKVKPRCIRKLWTNPMSPDGEWGLIFQDSPVVPGQRPNQNRQGRDQRGRNQQSGNQDAFGVPGAGKEVRVGPIIGVYSPVGDTAIKVFTPLGGGGGGDDISSWRFTKDLLQGLGSRGVGSGDGAVQMPTLNAEDIGKPWPPGISLPRFQGRQQNPNIGTGQNSGRGNNNANQGNNNNRGNN